MTAQSQQSLSERPQYTLTQILGIWAAAALPTALLAWGVTPILAVDP